MFLVAAKGNRANYFANCTVLHVSPVYPNGLDPLVIRKVTGQEALPGLRPDNATILSVKDLYFIGRTMETGRPLTETIMTIGGQNHLVRVGTPVGFLATEAGGTVQPGDRIIMGGPLRGQTAVNLEQGVDKAATGLFIQKQAEGLNPTDNACLGCGECERHCPARIMPGMISRCAEFKQFKRAEVFHIHSCIECGLCGYWCVAQRPLLQYIRLAKYELALLAGARTPSAPSAEDIEKGQTGDTPC
jgi:electron transport complex protein RnfC